MLGEHGAGARPSYCFLTIGALADLCVCLWLRVFCAEQYLIPPPLGCFSAGLWGPGYGGSIPGATLRTLRLCYTARSHSM